MSSLLAHKSVRVAKPTRGHQPAGETGQIRPDHELVDRLQQWKHIAKSLLHYYKGLAEIEHASARSTSALQETIQVPFHEGHVFSPEGWQAVLYDVRDNTKLLAERHTNFASTIERTVVKELENVRTNIKSQITVVEKEASALADDVEREREMSKHHLTELQHGIDTFENSATQMLPQKDPYLSHHIVQNQLRKQVHKENDLQAALIRFQQQQPAFEEGISKQIQSACKLYEEARQTHVQEIDELQKTIATALQRIEPDFEWKYFMSRTENSLIDPETPLRSVEAIQFPGQNHASTTPLKEGYLERKKRFSKKYTEAYYVLTPSGYLHERKSSNPQDTTAPTFSLFLPECSLGPAAKDNAKSHKFAVQGNKAHRSSAETKLKNTLRFGGKEIAYTFRARTHAEMKAWWEVLDQLSRDTKTDREPTQKVQRDPVGLAVSQVGYAQPDSATTHTAHSVASVPGTTTETVEPEQARSTTTGTSVHQAEDEDSEEGGGSSEEEFASDDEMAVARTAPSTPHPATATSTTNPVEESASLYMKSETLPAYVGSGTGVPEKAALANDLKGAPILGAPVGSSAPEASTSDAHTHGNAHGETHVETSGESAAPAALATTSSAS
ncbi:hypothetical protein JCM10296v2_004092 [Rhodotorula toruloides]